MGIPDEGRVRRLNVDLPPSPAAIDRVLAACGRERSDTALARPNGEVFTGLRWRNIPQPSFPSRTDSESGIAALRCTTDRGGELRNCSVESEFPEGGGFGRAAVLGAHRNGRVMLAEDATGEIGGRTIAFVVRYNMAPIDPRPPSRLNDNRATSRPPEN